MIAGAGLPISGDGRISGGEPIRLGKNRAASKNKLATGME
jgi:hypothetical protein